MVEMQIPVLLCVVASAAAMSLPDKSSPCHRVECRAGRECVVSGGVAQCLCVTHCPDHDIPVCGTDGRSYDNYCRLHQRACLSGTHISLDYKGYCKKDIELAMKDFGITEKSSTMTTSTTTTTTPPPEEELSVCYAPQRDALRNAVIQQWQRSVKKQPWYTEGMTYREALSGHFFVCDKNRDYKLRPDELMDCFADIPFVPRPEQDLTITRTLCVDAIIEDADKNSDWRLDFQEFTHLLDPLYHPQARKCSLEGKDYTDGAEVHVECNHCVCATGSWVCATHDCPEPRDQTANTVSDDDTFGYLDTKFDLDDTAAEKEKKKKESKLLDDIDDYSDEDYDSDESSVDLKKEEAKKEFMSLSLADQKKVKHLESNIKQFYDDMKKFNRSKNDSEKKIKAVLNTVTQTSKDIDDYSEETISEEEEDEEDDLLDEYDDLLEKSKKIREKLTSLRDAIHDLEDRQTDRHRQAMENDSHPNSVSTNVISRTTSAPVSKKQRLYDEFLRNKLERHRQAAQTDNDIWEDQWKAKIKKHQHASIGNHL